MAFSLQWLLLLQCRGCREVSVAEAHGLNCFVACGIFLASDRTHFPRVGRQTLNHWTMREVHRLLYFLLWKQDV